MLKMDRGVMRVPRLAATSRCKLDGNCVPMIGNDVKTNARTDVLCAGSCHMWCFDIGR